MADGMGQRSEGGVMEKKETRALATKPLRASVREHATSIARSLAGRPLGFTARQEAGAGVVFALCGALMVASYVGGWFA